MKSGRDGNLMEQNQRRITSQLNFRITALVMCSMRVGAKSLDDVVQALFLELRPQDDGVVVINVGSDR